METNERTDETANEQMDGQQETAAAARREIVRAALVADQFRGRYGKGSWAGASLCLTYADEVARSLRAETAEEAYRRGYYDGFREAMQVLVAVRPAEKRRFLKRLCSWVTGTLQGWKDSARRDRRLVEPPPPPLSGVTR